MSTDGNSTWCNTDGTHADNYEREKTLALIKIFKESGAIEMFFNDSQAKEFGVQPLAGHHNHVHVSWLQDKDRDILSPSIKTKLFINLNLK